MKMKRLVAVAVTALALMACGSTTADTVGLEYEDGPIQGENFVGVVEPGSGNKFLGPFDRIIRIPINKRDYTFCESVRDSSGGDGCDGAPITVTALGGAELAFEGGLSFTINTGDPELLSDFYEEVCRKFERAISIGLIYASSTN